MIAEKLIVVNGMTGQETPVKIQEGATPKEVLSNLGLQNYRLASVKNRHVFQPGQDISQAVQNGERLFAFAEMAVGGGA